MKTKLIKQTGKTKQNSNPRIKNPTVPWWCQYSSHVLPSKVTLWSARAYVLLVRGLDSHSSIQYQPSANATPHFRELPNLYNACAETFQYR